MKRFFITGSTGYVGSQLAMELAKRGNNINALYRDQSKVDVLNHPNISLIKGTLNDLDILRRGMQNCQGFFHTAAYTNLWCNNNSIFYQTNIKGTQNVINAAKQSGIKRGVFTSTAGIFGCAKTDSINENSLPNLTELSNYEISKLTANKVIAQSKDDNFHPIIVCPTRIFGPGILGVSNSITNMIKQYCNGRWHFIPGNGKLIANYVYINDVVNGHIQAFEKGIAGESYILGGENLSYNRLFEIIKQTSSINYSLFHIPISLIRSIALICQTMSKLFGTSTKLSTAFVNKLSKNYIVDIRKAIQEIDYNPTECRTAVNETINWLRKT